MFFYRPRTERNPAKGNVKTIHDLYHHSNVRSEVICEKIEVARYDAFGGNIVALIVTQRASRTMKEKVNMSRKELTIHLVERWLD